ncbi:SMN complex subunit Gem7 [Schizosaccharomyces pombe]|uniref:Gem-associated protein 7 homolog n=1 Tax=Schizosaccharomyces pombe (strain 972 / ATCC 24843) TaxID=284812 RepID=GEMI7_SCHPO|nr:protein new17 [Schizosaccharomyces pombe]G2TRR1.1 RecName: Full=Gem-associated protein 7 homolog [Schizosaccharomyces pombe 972h-]CCD31374.1 sequence orphan [Schizosaccharomyces pombe]|eukprot:NP_001343164.1 protein new17 [Schizosaccharomyces pombe]
MAENNKKSTAYIQRMRTLKFYQKMASARIPITVYLHDQREVKAEFGAIDSSESKLAVSNLQTDWGVINRAVIRTGDVVGIEYNLVQEEGEL